MKISQILAVAVALISLSLPACNKHKDETEAEQHTIVLTSPKVQDVTITQQYVCQIRSQRNIEVCALQGGYLEPILVKEGDAVKQNEVLFKVTPTLYKAKWDAEVAEAKLAELELKNTERLANQNPPVVSPNEVQLFEAKLAKAKAKMKLAEAEYNFTKVKAPFDGIIDRLKKRDGSLIKEGDVLTTLSDNSVMWVYFNVPEARYIEYQATPAKEKKAQRIELVLADGSTFPQPAISLRIEAQFNNENGNIPFRADFKNTEPRLLRHGMTGTIMIHRALKNALVIPQRATFEILDKQYVYVVDKDNVVHQRAIAVQNELEGIFVLKSGLEAGDKIVYEGVQQVHDGEKREEFEFRAPELVLANQKYHAE